MIEQGFNNADSIIKEMSDFFETRVENLELKEKKKKSSVAAKTTNKKSLKKRKREDPDSSIIESSEESTIEHQPNMKYCILYNKCSHYMDNYKDLHVMINENNQKKKRNYKNYENINKEINALIEKKFQRNCKKQKKQKDKKRDPIFPGIVDF